MNLVTVYSLGILTPFAALLACAGVTLLCRWVKRTVLYAKPKYLERRINVAAGLVDARRAYVLGGPRLQLSLLVGRQWTHEEQARAVLLDEFLPATEEPAKTPG